MKWWKLVVSFIKKIWVAICKFMNTETLITFPEQTPADPFSEFDLLRGTAYIEYIAGMGGMYCYSCWRSYSIHSR